ncbi:SusC/RagA family TonB-linked outer membrane protein, partial [Marinilabilia salmonicolor]|uniref:SusC/RagA family TonB-linked outer membrane protein n=2 Tax=Marinilabilia salmonicolor TaxID=989 RepID=UPI000468D397
QSFMKKQFSFYKILFLFLGLGFFISASAQEVTVTGTVTDAETGDPLPGVTVVIQGTQQGTITQVDGTYSVQVAEDASLAFSFIGYVTNEVAVAGQNQINIELEPQILGLDEVVVIGYGVQKKVDKTGAVSQVTAEDLNRGALTDPIQAMQGKSSGVMITKKGGDPNAGFAVTIRGASGFDSNTQPLYVIDGIPGADPTVVAPEDIATFDVLKDAASTAIYGSRGSNGVIIITTKTGKAGKGTVNFNASYSVDEVANTLDLLTADQVRNYVSENNISGFTDNGANTDWQDELFQTGYTQNYNLNFSGGNETSNYYASVTHADWDGVVAGTSKERTNLKLNFSHKAINDRLTLSGSLGSAFEQNDYENYNSYNKDDVIFQALQRNPTDPVYGEDGSLFQINRGFNYENPFSVINNIDNTRDAKRFMGNMKAQFEIIDGLIGTANLGYIRDDHENAYFRPNDVYNAEEKGSANRSYSNNTQKMIEGYFNYDKTFNEDHNLSLLGGYSWHEYVYDGFNAGGSDPSSDYIKYNNLGSMLDINRTHVGSYKGMWRLIGFFGRAQYNYQNKYYLSGSIRRDGSTKFGENNKWGVFPTVAAGWTISREEFMSSVDWLSNLKLRASYGVSGNQEIGEYNGQMFYEPAGLSVDPATGEDVITYTASKVANPDLQWEETTEINLGLDFGFLGSKISGSIELYQKTTTDLLGRYSVPVPPNPAPEIWANSGEVENKGVELNVQYFAINEANFKWKTSLAASHNQQELVDLGEYAPETGVRKEGWVEGRGLIGQSNWVTGIVEGESIGSFYLPEFVGLSGDGNMVYKTEAGGATEEISEASRYIAGSAVPDLELGWSNSFTFYEDWTLDFSFRSLIGNDVFNATQMLFDYPGDFPARNVVSEALVWDKMGRKSGPAVSDLYVEDASFIRLDYLSLGYTLKTNTVDWMENVKFSLTGNNLFTLTGYSGLDPETSVNGLAFGIDQYNVYPKTRSFSFGISATF